MISTLFYCYLFGDRCTVSKMNSLILTDTSSSDKERGCVKRKLGHSPLHRNVITARERQQASKLTLDKSQRLLPDTQEVLSCIQVGDVR